MPPSILILSACSGDKSLEPIVDCSDIDRWSRDDLTAKYPDKTLPARELYTGDEHEYVTEAVDRFARIADVDWRIVSAGFGLVRPETTLPTSVPSRTWIPFGDASKAGGSIRRSSRTASRFIA